MNRLFHVLCVISSVTLCSLLVPRAEAQTATVGGRIIDPTETVVSGAQVTALNTETNNSRVDTTDDTGLFRFTNLPPGPYHLTIEKPGFKAIHIDDLVLTVNQVFTFEAHLELGEVATTTIVSASELPLIDLENASISNLVDSTRIQDLPLLTRNPYELVLLSPGVSASDSGLGGFSTNGGNERNNNFFLDGVDNNNTYVPGGPGGLLTLNPDSTQEFRVITDNYSPEYGRNSGSVVQIVTRSGSNDLHGDAYWFGRYNALGARDFFNPAATGPQNPYVRNIFGASAGGPIIKDRTFWFANYEGWRFVTTLTGSSIVPTPEYKTGQFTVEGQPIDVSTPGSVNNAQGLPLDPTMQKILALFPNPNGPAVIPGLSGTLFFPSSSRTQLDTFTVRIDHTLTKKHILMGRYTYNRFTDPNPFHFDFLPGDLGAEGTYQLTQGGVIGLTSTFTERFINEFRFGFNRSDLQFNCQGVKTFDSFGFIDTYGRGADFSIPFGSFVTPGFGCQALSNANNQDQYTGTYQTIDNMSYVKGQHLLKWGVEFRDVYENSFNNYGSRGLFDFAAYNNFSVPGLSNLPAGSPLADTSNPATAAVNNAVLALQGYVDFQSQSQFFNKQGTGIATDERGFRQREWGLFIEDAWKVRPNLTVTYGLRWEYFGVPFEDHNNLSQLFADASGPAPFTFTIVGPGTGKTLYNNQFTNFEPRIGLAWDPWKDGKTSVRAGYGIYHDRVFGNLIGNSRSLPPFQQAFFASGTPSGILSQLTAPTVGTTSNVLSDGAGFFAQLIDPRLKTPYSQNWSVGVQHAITPTLTIEVDYVGVKGTDILRIVDANPPQPALVKDLLGFCVPGNPLNTGFATMTGQCDTSTLQFANLWYGQVFSTLPMDATNNNAFNNSSLGYPGSRLTKSIGSSIYNALQVNVEQRLSHGIQIQGAYTFSHAIDNVNDPLVAGGAFLPNFNFPHNTFDLAAERGNSDFDIRHRGVVNFIYEPNLGRGKEHLNSGFVGVLFEGWSVTGIVQAQTGHPYDIIGTLDSNHTGIPSRGYIINPRALGQPPGTDKTFTGPNAAAIGNTPFDVQPNTGKNEFYGPDFVNVDAAALKNTHLTEKLTLQFRLEAYNLFNHAQFSQPDNQVADIAPVGSPPGTFGQSLSTVTRSDGTTSARQLQFALKLIF
jgi:hypothetical protein